MAEGLEPLEYSVLAPNHYDVYLHPEDHRELEPLFPEIQREATRKLDETLQARAEEQKDRRLRLPWQKKEETSARFARKGKSWEITFCVDHEPAVRRGDLTIHSYFTVQRSAGLGAGAQTKRVVTRQAGGETHTARISYEDAPTLLARLRYTDASGEHEFEMTKPSIVIGRRDEEGRGYWADLRLDTRPDVSREHARLRFDPDEGAFFLKDLSRFGTTIDGEAVPSSVQEVEGERQDRDVWVRLPARARIALADIVTLEFEAVSTEELA